MGKEAAALVEGIRKQGKSDRGDVEALRRVTLAEAARNIKGGLPDYETVAAALDGPAAAADLPTDEARDVETEGRDAD